MMLSLVTGSVSWLQSHSWQGPGLNGPCVPAPPPVAVTRDGCVAAVAGGFVVVEDDVGGWASGDSDGSVVTTLEPGCSIKDKGQTQVVDRHLRRGCCLGAAAFHTHPLATPPRENISSTAPDVFGLSRSWIYFPRPVQTPHIHL